MEKRKCRLDRVKLYKAMGDKDIADFITLSKRCEMSHDTIGSAFRLRSGAVSWRTAYTIARELGVTVDQITKAEDEPPRKTEESGQSDVERQILEELKTISSYLQKMVKVWEE